MKSLRIPMLISFRGLRRNEYEIIEDPNVDFFQRVKEENELTASSNVDTK